MSYYMSFYSAMHSKYMINPKAPLIVEPTACAALSVSALKRNLVEHATFNPTIVSSGSKAELVARLETILETRKMDMVVRNMMWGD
jgi:spore coat polysaccharide biosynthesis protein SpsF (cytidylyltransferase family)